MDPNRKITKKFTKKFDNKVINRQYFHRKTGLNRPICTSIFYGFSPFMSFIGQPDDLCTLIYPALIHFIAHSLYHFINSVIVALKVILSIFINVKSIHVISGFNLKTMKTIARWRCSTKISKTNLETMISPLLTRPQECQGCQKIRKTTLVSLSAKIQSKLSKIQKTFRKRGFFDNFLFNFDSLFNFG